MDIDQCAVAAMAAILANPATVASTVDPPTLAHQAFVMAHAMAAASQEYQRFLIEEYNKPLASSEP